MLTHIVMWRLKEFACGHTRRENMDIIENELKALYGVVPNLLSVEIGRDALHSDMSYDMALICKFPDMAAMREYKAHPKHLAIAEYIKNSREARAVIDYYTE